MCRFSQGLVVMSMWWHSSVEFVCHDLLVLNLVGDKFIWILVSWDLIQETYCKKMDVTWFCLKIQKKTGSILRCSHESNLEPPAVWEPNYHYTMSYLMWSQRKLNYLYVPSLAYKYVKQGSKTSLYEIIISNLYLLFI